MGHDLVVGNGAGDGFPGGVHHDGGDAHDVAAQTVGGLEALDGVADGAGDSVGVELALDVGVLGDGSGEKRDGIMAALAVAGVLDALGADEDVNILAVEGLTKAVGVEAFAPLGVGGGVAVAAVGRVGKDPAGRNWPLAVVAMEGRKGCSLLKRRL